MSAPRTFLDAMTDLVHGEPEAACPLPEAIRAEFAWPISLARGGERVAFRA